MTPLGYPSSADLNRPMEDDRRKGESDIFSVNRYGDQSIGDKT